MEINKFGGASIKDAKSINGVVEICKSHINSGVVVVSAMGKSTNKLERIVEAYFHELEFKTQLQDFKSEFELLLDQLFADKHPVHEIIAGLLSQLDLKLCKASSSNYDFEYDQIVSYGELLTAPIVAAKLNEQGVLIEYIDARTIIKTDSNYREGEVNWGLTIEYINEHLSQPDQCLYLTQGFIASDINNLSVTLGREGSDYSAAIIGSVLKVDRVNVWKDVPGIMCADPNWMPGCEVLSALSYHESIELAFFGAKVLHPKTIKPLQNHNIPLHVRSFLDTNLQGSIISDAESSDIPPVYVRMQNQVLVSIWQSNYSFIVEKNLSHIFNLFDKHKIKVNLMQNSAISFSVCVDGEMGRVKNAINELKESYHVKYNDRLELISIRHIKPGVEEEVVKDRDILLEQKSRSMARYILKMEEN